MSKVDVSPEMLESMWFLLAPGAGAPCTSPWMTAWAARLRTLGSVESFDYPYMLAGRKRPDVPSVLEAAHRSALARGRARYGEQVVLIGKSMGSRIGCHVARDENVGAVVCLGYPLVPAGKAGPLREAALLETSAPLCLVQGTRDPLCPLDRLAPVLARRSGQTELVVVETGDHSLVTTKAHQKATKKSQEDIDVDILLEIRRFLNGLS